MPRVVRGRTQCHTLLLPCLRRTNDAKSKKAGRQKQRTSRRFAANLHYPS